MGETSGIEWTDATVNFWRGCTKVDPTCAHCYMFREQRRYGRDPEVVVRCGRPVWNAPKSPKWQTRAAAIEHGERRRMRVFTCSWSDFFHPAADAWRDEAWDVIRSCPEFDWQILASRPELIAERLPSDWAAGWPHVWLGVTIGNRRFVDRADELRQIPAAVRFISAEPLLGRLVYAGAGQSWRDNFDGPQLDLTLIDWLIVGGESGGPPARRLVDEHNQPHPLRTQWVADLRNAAVDAGTAFLFKQWGGPRPDSGGRILDGRTWDEFPDATRALLGLAA